MIKRYFSGLIALVVLALMLAACGDSTATPAPASGGSASAPTASGSMTTAAGGAMTTAASGAMTTAAAGGSTASGSDPIAPYTGATSVSAPAAFSQSFESSYLQSAGAAAAAAGFQFSYYATGDSADQVLTYYDGATTKAGFGKGPSQTMPPTSLGSTSVNAKTTVYTQISTSGASIYQVVVVGPLDATSAQAIGGTLQAGQSLIVTTHGNVGMAGMSMTPGTTP